MTQIRHYEKYRTEKLSAVEEAAQMNSMVMLNKVNYLAIYLAILLSIFPSIYLAISTFVYLAIYPSIFLAIYPYTAIFNW